ncbi:hypothetical protein [Demequina capsici]|uniref:Uncharacterized protein n=1 Tax=Demequina capsici TaxID=3075620 RepID=A0AA96JCK6_9MICO|nr:hypothetical protein [Demequina sp. OYTSA14]WNM23729.1 hypothetical protein RN606_10195 [Demequina sp. OYTSA14]
MPWRHPPQVDAAGLETVPVPARRPASCDSATSTLTYAGVAYRMGDQVAAGGGWSPTDDMTIPSAREPDSSGDVTHVHDPSLAPMPMW